MKLTLTHWEDTYNFVRGTPINLTKLGEQSPTLWERLGRRLLWWLYPPCVVTAVDHARGTITVGRKRWSWWRWRWV